MGKMANIKENSNDYHKQEITRENKENGYYDTKEKEKDREGGPLLFKKRFKSNSFIHSLHSKNTFEKDVSPGFFPPSSILLLLAGGFLSRRLSFPTGLLLYSKK